MATVQDFLTRCFRLAKIYAPGDSIPSDDMNDALADLNEMIGIFNNDGLMLYNMDTSFHSITAQTGADPRPTAITIGPVGADIIAARPMKILGANLTVTSTSPNVNVNLEIWNEQQYLAQQVLNIGSPIPIGLYPDNAFPNMNLNFWPYLNGSAKLELQTWSALNSALTLATTLSLPDGYNEVLRFNLAVRLGAEWAMPPDPVIIEIARSSKAALMAHNAPSLLQACDAALISSSSPGGEVSKWNYLIGQDN